MLLAVLSLFLLALSTPIHAQDKTLRIISLAPHLTEMVYSAGAGDQLVGVVNYSDYPQQAKTLPIIGSYTGINIEAVLALKPDLVLAWKGGNRQQDIERLQQLGIKVWQTDVKDLTQIPQQIYSIAQLTGTQAKAEPEVTELKNALLQLQQQYKNTNKVRTFYQIWQNPLITVNGKQFISQAIELCGGENIFADLPLLTPKTNIEAVIMRNPQVILLGGQPNMQTDWRQQWQKYPLIEAVNQQHIVALQANEIQRPTARLIRALPKLCAAIAQAR